MNKNKYTNFINRLREAQNEDGSFGDADSVLIYSAIILIFLNTFPKDGQLEEIKKRIADYLLSQKNESWVFSDLIAINFLALDALMGYDPELLDGKAMGHILIMLGSVEEKEGGPYYSDIKKPDGIDLGANAAIAYFLSLHEVELPNLTELIEDSIEKDNFRSDFLSLPMIFFLISKCYKGKSHDKLVEIIEKNIEKESNFSAKALMAVALGNLIQNKEVMNIEDFTPEKQKEQFLIFKENGREFFSPSILNEIFYMLVSSDSQNQNNAGEDLTDQEKNAETEMMQKILKAAEERFAVLGEEIREFAMREIKKTIKANPDKQMSLMSYFMRQALGRKGAQFSDDYIAQLGLANIFFWTAFIIYDNFWDEDEEADPRTLPTANLYARHFTSLFVSLLPKKSGFENFFQNLMDKLDAANTWETVRCRMRKEGSKIFLPPELPDYGNYDKKFEPASAHILGPVVMLNQLGYAIESSEIQNLIAYFKNYLIPKQINDDLHDWKEDLERGNISTVAAMLIEDFGKDRGAIDLEKDMEELQKIFWFKTLPRAGSVVLDCISRSRNALFSMKSIEDKRPLEQYIIHEEKIIKDALKEQKTTLEFLEVYK